ncbi:multiple epidermal growth factor-like domains protein 11 isoform X5 [Magallana gigas]|uniref:multiple epidermal growth factor-like domains protein 11 isoform X5 n=1 Tax=Magallana gigas TaxID=29159 RepID=UPI0033427727
MVSLFGHSVYHLGVLTVWFCLLAVSQAAYVNVALNKPAYLQYPWYSYSDTYDASNAVDGRKSNLSWYGGQCAVSGSGQTATWWVDLTSIHSIHNITIYFLTGNNLQFFYRGISNYFLGFSVYVSNTTDRLQGTLCYKDDNFTALTIPSVFTTTCPVHGQFVIYYNERLPGVTYPDYYSDTVASYLCEVEVYGCPGGFYGANCSNACPDTNCYCHLETGTCQGCKPGFQGFLCKSACSRGYYGAECQQECGHCRDVTQCVHTNGSCLTGCEVGYDGETCKAPCLYGFFGPDCADRCNDTCDGCNRFNGSCDTGCNPGWQGYECQDVNVALNKPAYQQNSVPGDTFDASNVVDGRKSDLSGRGGQCAGSYDEQTATWWVNLTTIHSIYNITIYFMTYTNLQDFYLSLSEEFLGFSVYVSNTTDRLQGTLCYKDDNFTRDTIPAVFTTTCPVHGQYVIYYNERLPGVTYPYGYSTYVCIGLCEVEVYGCPGGFYGANCSNACPDTNCYCHLETGTCQGCTPGFQGYLCKSACSRGYYGAECQQECGYCRDLTQCVHTNGSCLTGCEAGYHGVTCKAPCLYGFFGPDCADRCNDTCGGCNRFNGSCDTGCNPGWQGYECQDACDKGSFGDNCSKTCGYCREVDRCSNINGTCLTGCDAGYHKDLCKTPCPYGFFGPDCANRCNDACDGCDRFNGSCNSGCNPGWQGIECHDACDKRSFGDKCSKTCGYCRDVDRCSNINGTCLTGCDAGYHKDLCKTPCPYGFFGPDCANRCNDACDGCDRFNGSCNSGCNPGWEGIECQDACDKRSFGDNCSESCGHCLDVDKCSNINGTCLTGCEAGFQGELCKTQCDRGFFGVDCNETCGHCQDVNQCFHTNGTCLTGCIAGFQGDLCKTPCQRGFFGENCNNRCLDNCAGCNDVTGMCEYGCLKGYTGYFCENVRFPINDSLPIWIVWTQMYK